MGGTDHIPPFFEAFLIFVLGGGEVLRGPLAHDHPCGRTLPRTSHPKRGSDADESQPTGSSGMSLLEQPQKHAGSESEFFVCNPQAHCYWTFHSDQVAPDCWRVSATMSTTHD